MTAVRPLDALESHVRLLRALKNPSLANLIVAGSGSSGHSTMSGDYAKMMFNRLDRASTVVVTDRMLDEVLRRMPGVPFGDPLREDDMIFANGYVVFPRPVYLPNLTADDHGDVRPERSAASFDAGFWLASGIAVEPLGYGGAGSTDGVMYTQCVATDRAVAAVHETGFIRAEEMPAIERGVATMRRSGLAHIPVYSAGWAYDVSWDPEFRDESYVLTPAGEFERRFWMTFWRMLGEEIVAPISIPRGDRRRAGRLLANVPDVVICDLRKIRHVGKSQRLDDGSTVMWSHRWRVGRHMRYCPKCGIDHPKEKHVEVRAYVKGPKNMPLLEKDKVWRLDR